MEKATFAGGCFWCMVKPFDQFEGIEKVTSGYMGGHIENPTYEDVKRGNSGHVEVVQIEFDPTIFSYERLLEIYWMQIDPTDAGGQFHDRGESYKTVIIVVALKSLLLRKLQMPQRFGLQKTIIKIIIKKNRHITKKTALNQVEMNLLIHIGINNKRGSDISKKFKEISKHYD